LQMVWEAAGRLAVLQIGTIVAAGIVQGAWFMRDMGNRINAAALGQQLRKLIDAGNAERAAKLCMASSSPVARLARVGVDAQIRGESARDAMRSALPQMLKEARSGLAASLAVGAIGLIEALLLLWRGMEMGFGDGFAMGFGWVPLLLVVLGIRNGLRWGGTQGELLEISTAVGGG